MANHNEQQPKKNQQQPFQSVSDSLMADLYYGTPIGLDNNSGEFNVNDNTPEEVKNRI